MQKVKQIKTKKCKKTKSSYNLIVSFNNKTLNVMNNNYYKYYINV
jgi:hypothetical protein